MKSNVYTRGGDKGQTSLIGGRRVGKEHIRIEAYGTIDELMANVALLYDMTDSDPLKEQLLEINNKLMVSASVVASDEGKVPEGIPCVNDDDVLWLEKCIDEMDMKLPTLKTFILPGGYAASSQAHIARTICRRAERMLLRLARKEQVDETVLKYVNRLSDYFFLIARTLQRKSGEKEIQWNP